jgi:uncharacterized protein (DUF2237 family)
MSAVETIRFRLRAGVSESEFLQHNRRVEDEYMARRPGFRSRETALAPDGEWLVMVRWASAHDAEATMESFLTAAETRGFLGAVDPSSVSSSRYDLVDY